MIEMMPAALRHHPVHDLSMVEKVDGGIVFGGYDRVQRLL
jgi:hypothetical protein